MGRPGGDEAELVRRAREGDDEAFRLLCEQSDPALRSRASSWLTPAVRRKFDPADVVQEAYLTAHQRLADFECRGAGSFGRWLARIVDNKARHFVRRYRETKMRRGEISSHGEIQVPEALARDPTASQTFELHELKAMADAAVEGLPAHYREVLRLVQEEHLSIAEVARVIDRSEDATRKLYQRALERANRSMPPDTG